MKDERLYKQLRELNNKELIYHAYRIDIYTKEVTVIAQDVLQERILTEKEIIYKDKIIEECEDSLLIENSNQRWGFWTKLCILNNLLLISLAIIIIFVGFFLVPFQEHTLSSYSVLTLVSIGLIWIIVAFNKKRPWTIQFLLAFNIPISLIVGSILLIMAFYSSSFMIPLTIIGVLGFIILNNYLLLSSKIQELFSLTSDRCIALFIINCFSGVLCIIGLYYSLQSW